MIQKALRAGFNSIKKILKSTPLVSKLIYDIKNNATFSDLYEHEKMLADKVRVDTYYKAIQRNIKPEHTVIDLGTGTGILALFAAKQGAKQVYAIDHSSFIEVAKQIAERNQVRNIKFINSNSRDFTPPEKIDILLHEQIGDDLFEENMIENLLDLKKRVLKEDGKILPAQFELYLEPVSLKEEYRTPFIWENPIHGINFDFIPSINGIENFKHSNYIMPFVPVSSVKHFLCYPEPIVTFNLNNMKNSSELPSQFTQIKKVTQTGQCDGLILFFKVIFDEETQFDTSPSSTRTHWGNRIFRFPSKHYTQGEELTVTANMKDIINTETWEINLTASS